MGRYRVKVKLEIYLVQKDGETMPLKMAQSTWPVDSACLMERLGREEAVLTPKEVRKQMGLNS